MQVSVLTPQNLTVLMIYVLAGELLCGFLISDRLKKIILKINSVG